ncbi:MAG: ammonium transporter, partial [Planctomycetota bacterium]
MTRMIWIGCVVAGWGATPALAEDGGAGEAVVSGLDTLWVLLAAALVFFMQAGFGMVEAGLIRTKNAANVLMKNL